MQSAFHLDLIGRTTLESGLIERLASRGLRRRFAAGGTIQIRGASTDGYWLIVSGSVTVCRFGLDGETTVFGVLGCGQLFGELAFFAGIERQVDAIAAEDCELVWIDRRLNDALLDADPRFAKALLASLANQLRVTLNRIEADSHRTAQQRAALVLADLAQANPGSLRLTQQQLADQLGVSRITIGQVMTRLSEAGLIRRGYGRIEVPDPGILRAFAER